MAQGSGAAVSTNGVLRTLSGTLHALSVPPGIDGGSSGSGGVAQFYLRASDGASYALVMPPGADVAHLTSSIGRPVRTTFREKQQQQHQQHEEGQQGGGEGAVNATAGGQTGGRQRTLVLEELPLRLPRGGTSRRLLAQMPAAPTPTGAVSIIVFIMDLSECGIPPATTPQAVTAFLSSTQPQNLAGMYDACTAGAARLDAAASVVMTVSFPCGAANGATSAGVQFDTRTCSNNVVAWQDYAADAAGRAGYSLTRFHHRALILPKDHSNVITACNFAALGSQGRWGYNTDAPGNGWGYGAVWIGGSLWNSAPIYWHELGHNYGLLHARNEVPSAGTVGNTNDPTCAMGSYGGTDARCHNAPHLWAMAWASPAVTLSVTDVRSGLLPRLLTIAAQSTSSPGPIGAQVQVSSSLTFAISFRRDAPTYDAPFSDLPGVQQGVAVHRVPSGQTTTDTALVALLVQTGDAWVDSSSLLSVTLVGIALSVDATIALCTRASLNTPCYTGGVGSLPDTLGGSPPPSPHPPSPAPPLPARHPPYE
ncbi:hypothetical protein FOA52_010412 [Chlamydomonas sp. UWO 241]|nr:hypothetical protein FOA52_010412 [Chlamydomonas sp. UWO 241]